jgi:hypothetical protein
LLQCGEAVVFLGALLVGLEDEGEALQDGLLPGGEQVGTELVGAAQLRVGLLAAEQFEDHPGLELGREGASGTSRHACETPSGASCSYHTGLTRGAHLIIYLKDANENGPLQQRRTAASLERKAHVNLLHEMFGNPFQASRVDATWLVWNDGTVRRIAQAIYDERAFDRMPILADALEDAGCDDADILRHCREPGEHVRGCWVIDLLLGKE